MNHRSPQRVSGSHRQVGPGLLHDSARRCASNMAHDFGSGRPAPRFSVPGPTPSVCSGCLIGRSRQRGLREDGRGGFPRQDEERTVGGPAAAGMPVLPQEPSDRAVTKSQLSEP